MQGDLPIYAIVKTFPTWSTSIHSREQENTLCVSTCSGERVFAVAIIYSESCIMVKNSIPSPLEDVDSVKERQHLVCVSNVQLFLC